MNQHIFNNISYLTFMWLLSSVNQVVFLQVSKLGETFATGLTFEGSFSTVHTKMNLRVEGLKKVLVFQKGILNV